jgi:hypothetical protein
MESAKSFDPTMWTGNLHANNPGTFLGRPRVSPDRDSLKAAGVTAAFLGFPPAGVRPARQLSLQPVAIGAVVEVTKRLKPSV